MSEPTDERAPDVVEDLALGAFRAVKEKLSFELDFTPDTLPVLDHYLLDLRADGEPDDAAVSVMGPCAGAYFGEVVRRSLPELRWHCPRDDYRDWRLEGETVFLCFNPVGVALEAVFGEPLAEWNAHFTLLPEERTAVDRSLQASGPVREEDYYRLAIRYEVLEQTMSVLLELSRRKGEHRRFGPDVYAALDGEQSGVDA